MEIEFEKKHRRKRTNERYELYIDNCLENDTQPVSYSDYCDGFRDIEELIRKNGEY